MQNTKVIGLILVATWNLQCSRGEGCPQSIPTRNEVDACPKSIKEWKTAKERKQCHVISQNCTTENEFEYHCLPHIVPGMFVEVCAPTMLIVGQHCPSYDMERNIIGPNFEQSCKEHLNPCLEVYKSSSVYQYQECYIYKKTNNAEAKNIASPVHITNENTVLNNGLYVICASLVILIGLLSISVCCPGSCKGMHKRILKCDFNNTNNSQDTNEGGRLNGSDTDDTHENQT